MLSRERIIAAALSIIDSDGVDALSMRRLGTELGVAPMAVYRYLPNRDAVLAAVVNHHFRTALVDVSPDEPWPEATRRFAHAYRAVLLDHPRAVPLLATHPVDQEVGLAGLSGLLHRFASAGIDQEPALMVIQSVAVFVLGHALAQVGTPDPGGGPPAHDASAAAYYDAWFDAGLTALITGFQADG